MRWAGQQVRSEWCLGWMIEVERDLVRYLADSLSAIERKSRGCLGCGGQHCQAQLEREPAVGRVGHWIGLQHWTGGKGRWLEVPQQRR